MSALMGQSGRNIAIIDGTFFNLSSANYPDYYLLCNDIESINVSFVSDNEGVIVENQIWWGNYMIGYACQINFDSLSTEELTTIPDRIIVSPNYPNPFNPETTLEVSLSNSGNVEIFDILGREINSRILQAPGDYTVKWGGANKEGKSSPAGIYLYRISDNETQKTGKMTLLDGCGTSGLSIKYRGNTRQNNLAKAEESVDGVYGTLYVSGSCFSEVDSIPMIIYPNQFINYNFYLNQAPYAEDRVHSLYTGDTLNVDMNTLFINDNRTYVEMEENNHFVQINDSVLQYIATEPETLSTEFTGTDSMDTSLIHSFSITTYASVADTTSHVFVWKLDTLGIQWSYLTDVAIVNEEELWLAGCIRMHDPDSIDGTGYVKWKVAHWTPDSVEYMLPWMSAKSIIYFNENDIWVCDGIPWRWNGTEWSFYQLWDMGVLDPDDGGVNYAWGTSSSDIYFAGYEGTIVYYDGENFVKMDSGTDIYLKDIDGTPDGEHVFIRGFDETPPGRNIILEYHGSQWDTLYYIEDHYYPEPGDYGHIEGIGVFGDTLYASTVAGIWRYNYLDGESTLIPASVYETTYILNFTDVHINSPNDIFFSDAGFIYMHYNGDTYYVNRDIYDTYPYGRSKWGSDYNGNIAVMVGHFNSFEGALIVRGFHEEINVRGK